MSIEKIHGEPRGSTTTLTAPIEILNMFADRLAPSKPGREDESMPDDAGNGSTVP